MPAIPAPRLPNHHVEPRPGVTRRPVVAAVVLTVRIVVPPPVTDAGLNAQLAPVGNPEQELAAKLMVPL